MRSIKTALLPAVLTLGTLSFATAQTKPAAAVKKAPPAKSTAAAKGVKTADGFTRLPSSLEYKIIKKGPGTRNPEIGDHIEMFIHVHIKDSVLFDSRKMYSATNPVPFVIAAPKYRGDIMEGFMRLAVGDSAVIRTPVDSMRKAGNQLMPWMKDGMKVEYEVVMVAIRSEAEDKKFMEEKAAKQKGIDDAVLQEYFKANNITPQKTASGLYYTVSREGTGELGKAGNMYSVNYTGKLLNGKAFDSNTDTAFHHTEPLNIEIGKGRVIRGWDEGLLLLKKGAKATLYIPSTLAYGPQEQRNIPANSVLVFDVEVLDIMDPNQKQSAQKGIDDQLLQDYFTKNNLKPTKTESGLYYIITQKGLGENAKPGNKVSMNYTGKTLDGKVFDSNMDPKFGHVKPFEFQLGMGNVIQGWDEGIQLLKIGSKATLFIPSHLAYGAAGAGSAIPPNAVLIFDVECLGIDRK
jgi:FKBP-type peptidyl-prolyl cis-trans isomerase